MVVGEMSEHTDVAVIGSGPAGYVAAIRAGQLGKMVTLVEKDPRGLGGICLHHGCIPSKSLIHIANTFWEVTHSTDLGIHVSTAQLDFSESQAFKNKVVDNLANGIKILCEKAGVDIVYGKASFVSSNELHIEQEHDTMGLTADKIILATGTKPAGLPNYPFDGQRIISSTDALNFEKIPASLGLVGGGYISVELAHVFQKMGSQVTIVQRSPRLLSKLDEQVSHIMEKQLTSFGVKLVNNTDIVSVDKTTNGVRLNLKDKSGALSNQEFEKILLATGRVPALDNMGIENTKITRDAEGFVTVDDQCRTSDPHILAAGDITGPPLLAHRGFYMGKIAAEVCAGLPSGYNAQVVPSVVYSDPEIGYVGLQEPDAIAKGISIISGLYPFSASGRAQGTARPLGFVKLIANPNTHVLIGATLVGSRIADLMGEVTLAIEMGATLEDIAGTIHPHPTYGEAVAEAAEVALKKSVHVAGK